MRRARAICLAGVSGGSLVLLALSLYGCFKDEDQGTVATTCNLASLGNTPADATLKAFVQAQTSLTERSASLRTKMTEVCNAMNKDLGLPSLPELNAACNSVATQFAGAQGASPVPDGGDAGPLWVGVIWSPECARSTKAEVQCLAQCAVGEEGGACNIGTSCQAATAGKCAGDCTGICSNKGDTASACNGECRGECKVQDGGPTVCAGECRGSCTAANWLARCSTGCNAGFRGRCEGTCNGKCDGNPIAPPGFDAGDPDAGPQPAPGGADANCKGVCTGQCNGKASGSCTSACTGEFAGGPCQGGRCTGQCSSHSGGCTSECTGACRAPATGNCTGTCVGKCSVPFADDAVCAKPLNCQANSICQRTCALEGALQGTCPKISGLDIRIAGSYPLYDAVKPHVADLLALVDQASLVKAEAARLLQQTTGDFKAIGVFRETGLQCVEASSAAFDKAEADLELLANVSGILQGRKF